jgi:hypothetical protein
LNIAHSWSTSVLVRQADDLQGVDQGRAHAVGPLPDRGRPARRLKVKQHVVASTDVLITPVCRSTSQAVMYPGGRSWKPSRAPWPFSCPDTCRPCSPPDRA